jgi:four helix bundle protein
MAQGQATIRSFRDLFVFPKSRSVALRVIRLADSFPRSRGADVVAGEIIESATSVPSNIAEGFGRFGKRQYVQYLRVAHGSASETESWLSIIEGASYAPKGTVDEIEAENQEVLRMLGAMIGKLETPSVRRRAVPGGLAVR